MSKQTSNVEAGHGTKRKGAELMKQMGIGTPWDMDAVSHDEDINELEAEFAALSGGDVPVKKVSKKKKGQVSISEIEQMAAQGLQDLDEDVSDTEDPELVLELAELQKEGSEADPAPGHTTPKDSQPAELEDFGNRGDSDRKTPKSHDSQSSHQPETNGADGSGSDLRSSKQETLENRRAQYRQAALMAKRDGDMPTAARYARIAKQFDAVLHALEQGEPVDLSDMPPALSETSGNGPLSTGGTFELPPEPTEEESKKLFQAPEAPKTVMEALTQRLEKYKSSEKSAKQAGDTSKARRMGRIVKQYEAAIQEHRAGKPVRFEDLPTPPGFGPIPMDSNPPQQTTPSLQDQSNPPSVATTTTTSTSTKTVTTTTTVAIANSTLTSLTNSDQQQPDGDAVTNTTVKAKPSLKRGTSRQEYQWEFLQERMEEFRRAALKAKRRGDLETAKQHLRSMKGVEEMIEALKGGQPVDISQVPPSPPDNDSEDKHLVVSADDVTPVRDRDGLFAQLEEDLISQMRMCATNSQHFTKVGDIPAASKFQKLEQSCRKDLELLKNARRLGDPVPKFHYESRTFSVIQCNTELGDGEMELTIVRGIALSLPSGFSEKDMDTMVKYEFAFPSDSPQAGQTSAVKSTVNPEYGESYKLQIDRKTRSFARFVERKGIKLEIYIKRGFLKGDHLLGSTTVKLSSLDTKCTLHDSYDLAEGRKSVGGKLEVKVRVREPFKGRQVDQSQEKWLVIDQFIHAVGVKEQKTKSAKSSICTLS